MSNRSQNAYEYYCNMCICFGIIPLSIDGWESMCKGEIPAEAISNQCAAEMMNKLITEI